MKKKFLTPTLDIVQFNAECVLQVSGGEGFVFDNWNPTDGGLFY